MKRHMMQEKVRDITEHINIKELNALLTTIKRYKEDLKGRNIIWFTDSVTAKAAIARQGTQAL